MLAKMIRLRLANHTAHIVVHAMISPAQSHLNSNTDTDAVVRMIGPLHPPPALPTPEYSALVFALTREMPPYFASADVTGRSENNSAHDSVDVGDAGDSDDDSSDEGSCGEHQIVDDDAVHIYQVCMHAVDEYCKTRAAHMIYPNFEQTLKDEVLLRLCEQFVDQSIQGFFRPVEKTRCKDEIRELMTHVVAHYFTHVAPPRAHPHTHCRPLTQDARDGIAQKLAVVRDLDAKNPPQGTAAWHDQRNRLFTASTMYKVFGTPAVVNSLVYEKCSAFARMQKEKEKNAATNDAGAGSSAQQQTAPLQTWGESSSPMAWGHKYEPVSVEMYEHKYRTTVAAFGCIPHREHVFIGASPDGINVCPTSDRFGRLVEIKNVVSREINGIPKKEYWVQMQMQMEVCDLDECDFLETKFVEYESRRQFLGDGSFTTSERGEQKGVIIVFVTSSGETEYVRKPVHEATTLEAFGAWEEGVLTGAETDGRGCQWLRTCFWRCEVFSCVLVERNRDWFGRCVGRMGEVWGMVLAEREGDFSNRAPRQQSAASASSSPATKCVLLNREPKPRTVVEQLGGTPAARGPSSSKCVLLG